MAGWDLERLPLIDTVLMSINVGEVELQDPTSSSAPPQRSTRTAKLSFAQIAKLKLRASELALSARVDAALNEKDDDNNDDTRDSNFSTTSTPRSTSSRPTSPLSSSRSNAYNAYITMQAVVAVSKTIHLVILPLLIISFLVIVILLYYGKEVLVPFVIAIFFTYLLRPVVNFLTTPYQKCYTFIPCLCPHDGVRRRHHDGVILNDDDEDADEEVGLLTMEKKRNAGSAGGGSAGGSARTPRLESMCFTEQLPRPCAVMLVMILAVSILGGGVLLVTDAVQNFERDDLLLYQDSYSLLMNQTLKFVKLNFDVDGTYLLSKVAEQVGVIDIFRAIIMFCVNATVNIFWVLLFVLYLLYEQNKDSSINARSTVPSSGGVVRTSTLRQDIDNQIQRYLVLKTLISACVGGGVWLWLGLILHVRLGKVVLFFNF